LLITDLEIGGTPTVVRELTSRLHEPGKVEIQVACLKPRGPLADQIEAAGVRVIAFDARSSMQLPSTVRRLRDLVTQGSIDTVVSFLVHSNAVAALAARKLPGVRFFQSIQTTQPHPRWHWVVQKWAQSAAEKIVVPSPSAARVAGDWADIPTERIVVIPNAVEVPESTAPLRWDGKTVRVGFLGRLDPVKRIPDLIGAISLLDARFVLDIYGEGAERSAIEKVVRNARLSDRVRLHGVSAQPQAAIAGMHVLVLPSQAEGFGLVLIEAMAQGVPVVATDVDGIRDVVTNGLNGLLVPVASPDALAGAIRKVEDDADLRDRLIRSGLETVRKRFSWPSVIQQYRELLRL
jgi:glycosyltransferase involved in cell wall biosynthesis